jgi:hypothetical protein
MSKPLYQRAVTVLAEVPLPLHPTIQTALQPATEEEHARLAVIDVLSCALVELAIARALQSRRLSYILNS